MQQQNMYTKTVLDNWHGQVSRTTDFFNKLTDEDLQKEVAPGKNRALYLLGHLTAVHDRMLPLLGFEAQKYPQLDQPFLMSADRVVSDIPSAQNLRAYWKDVNETLAAHLNSMQPEQWLEKHTSVSEEDFAKEPHRNKLNVVAGRTLHLANHLGQLLLLNK